MAHPGADPSRRSFCKSGVISTFGLFGEGHTLVKKAIESPELQIISSAYNLNFDIQSATALRNTLADNRQELVVRFNLPSNDFVRYLERSDGYV